MYKCRTMALSFILILLLLACGDGAKPSPPPPNLIVKSQCLSASQWAFSAKGAVRSTAVTDEYAVYFGDSAGMVYSVNKSTGALNWEVSLGGALDTKFVLMDAMLFIVSDSGYLFALNASNGSQLWQFELGKFERSQYDYNISSPAIHEDKVFIVKESGELVGLNLLTGEANWQVNLQSAAHSVPLISNGKVCVSSMTALSCSDINSEKLLWSKSIDWPSSPTTDGQSIIVGSREDYAVHSYSLSTGEQIWKHDVVDWAPGEAIIYNNIVYIGSSDNHAFLSLNLATGERNWRAEGVANIFTKPVVYEDTLIFSSGYAYNTPGFGIVKAVDTQGQTLWSLSGCNFFSSPVIDQENIFIGSDDGYFYALDVDNS